MKLSGWQICLDFWIYGQAREERVKYCMQENILFIDIFCMIRLLLLVHNYKKCFRRITKRLFAELLLS
jgi:hypothetical protein